MPTIFTKILSGEIPCHKIAENEKYLAFLDIRPINPGHTLVIPKKEVDYLFDIEDELLAGLFTYSKKVATAIRKAIPCKKIGVLVYGLEVPHAHVHLVPVHGVPGEFTFAKAKPTPNEELALVAEKIKREFR